MFRSLSTSLQPPKSDSYSVYFFPKTPHPITHQVLEPGLRPSHFQFVFAENESQWIDPLFQKKVKNADGTESYSVWSLLAEHLRELHRLTGTSTFCVPKDPKFAAEVPSSSPYSHSQ